MPPRVAANLLTTNHKGERHEIPQEPVPEPQCGGLLRRSLPQGRKLLVPRLRLRPRLPQTRRGEGRGSIVLQLT
jgi:hypothetical protein